MLVDVVFVKYHHPELLTTALRSLQETTDRTCLGADLTRLGKTVVVCNDHLLDGFDKPSSFPLLVVDSHQNSYAHGCNVGFKHSTAPLVCFCNTDVEFTPGWLPPLVNCFSHYPTAIVAPKLLLPDGTLAGFGCTRSFIRPSGWKEPDGPQFSSVGSVLSVGGACFMARRSLLEKTGGLDENYPFYYEETDLCLQARQLGHLVLVCGSSRVIHKHRGSSRTHESRLSQAYDVSHRYFWAKWAEFLRGLEVEDEA